MTWRPRNLVENQGGRYRLVGEQVGEDIHGLDSILRLLGEGLENQSVEVRRDVGVERLRRGRGDGDMLQEVVAEVLSQKWGPAAQHLEKDDPEGIDVGAMIDLRVLAHALLWRHVGGRAHEGACARARRGRGEVGPQLGDAEVKHLDVLAALTGRVGHDEHVVGFEVAMDDADGVGGGQCRRDLPGDEDGLLDGHSIDAAKPVGKALALQELHHHVGHPLGEDADVDDVDDVGMLDRVGGPGFVEEALHVAGVGSAFRLQDLDGGFALEKGMNRKIHRPHPTFSKQTYNLVVVYLLADHRVYFRIGETS